MYRLLEELNMKHFRQNTKGKKAYLHSNGQATFFSGEIPPTSPIALIELQMFLWSMSNLVSQFPKEKSIDIWNHPQARELDCMTVGSWGLQNMWSEAGRNLLNQAVRFEIIIIVYRFYLLKTKNTFFFLILFSFIAILKNQRTINCRSK